MDLKDKILEVIKSQKPAPVATIAKDLINFFWPLGICELQAPRIEYYSKGKRQALQISQAK